MHPQQSPATTGISHPGMQRSSRRAPSMPCSAVSAPQGQRRAPYGGGAAAPRVGDTTRSRDPKTVHCGSPRSMAVAPALHRCSRGRYKPRQGPSGPIAGDWHRGGAPTPAEGGRGWRSLGGGGRVIARLELGWGGACGWGLLKGIGCCENFPSPPCLYVPACQSALGLQ
jgi:hypothetical protein